MSSYELIPEEVYENLPDDPHEKFVMIVKAAQANLARLLDDGNSRDFFDELRAQFISSLTSAADALGIDGLPELPEDMTDYRAYKNFQVRLSGIVAKVRLQQSLVSRPHSVELGRVNKAWIRQEVAQLRVLIKDSDLPPSKRDALLEKLDEFDKELDKQRLGFAKTMAIAASIMTVVGAGTTTLANSPKASEAIVKIIRLIGKDKELEEAERQRLSPPAKELVHQPKPQASGNGWGFAQDLDDDIPF
jgi:hypothetical protein